LLAADGAVVAPTRMLDAMAAPYTLLPSTSRFGASALSEYSVAALMSGVAVPTGWYGSHSWMSPASCACRNVKRH
jgi:hypothetical protein